MILKIIVGILMGFLGIMFSTNIIVFNNQEKAVKMHREMHKDASLFLTNLKTIITFICGIGFLLAVVSFFMPNIYFFYAGTFGALLFFLFYIIEFLLWFKTHKIVIPSFFTIGIITALLGVYCFIAAKSV